MPDRRHVAVLAGLAGYVLFTVTADLVNPDWSPVETMISHYVHARAGWLIPAGLLSLAAASALVTRLVEPVAPRAALVLLRIWTAAVLVGAVFPADPYGRWDQPPTVPGLLHGLAALTAFTVLPGAAVSLTLARRPITRPAAVLAALTVPAYLLLLAAFADVQDGPSVTWGGWESLIGLTERLMLWIYVGWLAVTAAMIRPPAAVAPPVRAGRH